MRDLGSSTVATVMALLNDEPWLAAVVVAVVVVLWSVVRDRGPRARSGEVWFGMVPFEDGSGGKDRPVLILSVDRRACTVARFTSQDRSGRADYRRVPSGVPGLPKASWICLRPMHLRRSALRPRVGDPGEAFVAWFREVSAPGR